jgi:glucokinase
MRTGIGVDLGGTKILGIIMREDGEILQRAEGQTGDPSSEKEVLKSLFAVIESLLRQGSASSIGIGCAGPDDFEKQIVVTSPNLPFIKNYPLKKLVEERFGIPTLVDNDVKTAALGELIFGEGKSLQPFFFITLGTGIGGALVSEDRIFRGISNMAGEIGHVVLNLESKERCGCGKYGCFEILASGIAVRRYTLRSLESGACSVLQGTPAEKIDARLIAEKAREGDKIARQAYHQAAYWIGVAFSCLVQLLNPRAIIIGGGMSEAWDLMEDRVLEVLYTLTMEYPLKHLEIRRSLLGNMAGVMGAAFLGLMGIKA